MTAIQVSPYFAVSPKYEYLFSCTLPNSEFDIPTVAHSVQINSSEKQNTKHTMIVKIAVQSWARTYAPASHDEKSSGTENSYFHSLVSKWRTERGPTSSVAAMAVCPSYQRIIGMGSAAIPLILRQLESEGDDPDHWSWALRAVTGENPVPDNAVGNMKAIAKAWLDWARDRYVW